MMQLASTVFTLTLVTLFAVGMPAASSHTMHVEVDIFSSRPNPHWNITCEEADEFLRLFQALPESSGEALVNTGLGYNGLIVTKPGSTIAGYDQVTVFRGWVTAWHDDQSTPLIDRGRTLERWLLQTGKGRIDDQLYQLITVAAQFE